MAYKKRGLAAADEETRKRVARMGGQARKKAFEKKKEQ